MAIVIVSEYVDDSQNSTGFYWDKFIKLLFEEFSEIKVISTKKSVSLFRGPKSIELIAVPSLEEKKTGPWLKRLVRILNSISLFIYCAIYLKKRDILFCGTNPNILYLLLGLLKTIKGYKCVTLVHDVFPENMIVAKILKDNSTFYKFLRYISNFSLSESEEIICIGRDMVEIMQEKVKDISKINYIPNFAPIDQSKPEGQIHLSKEITFSYFGNMGPLQGIGNFIEALSLVKRSNCSFLFSGEGLEKEAVRRACQKNSKHEMKFIDPSSFEKREQSLLAGDIAIIPLVKGMYGLAVPSKAYFSMAANKYLFVLGDENSELHRMISENPGLGWFVRSNDIEGIARQIEIICEEGIQKPPNKPLQVLSRDYSFNSISEKYVDIFSRLYK